MKSTHTRIAFGQNALTLSDDNVATIQRSIDSLDARVRGGEGTPLDVNRAKQQQAKAQAERSLVVRDLAKERRRMLELIGFAGEGAEWTADVSATVVSATSIDEPAAIALAASQRLDVAAARSIVEAQQADLSVEERSRLKDFGLGADFERDVDGKKTIGPVLEVGIPIFDTNAAQIAKAGSLARVALASYEAVSQRAVREARVAWVEFDSASRLAGQYRTTVLAISERNLTLAEAAPQVRPGRRDGAAGLTAGAYRRPAHVERP
ncbi:MAG: TolC family protein [Phycisphaerales bacterium]|nr:TolC family protein [Phycisphaerales bacterium]